MAFRKNKKFIDPRYFMDEKMEHDDPQKCPPGETWEGDEMGEGECRPLNEAHAAEHEGTCKEAHPDESHSEWKASEAEKK